MWRSVTACREICSDRGLLQRAGIYTGSNGLLQHAVRYTAIAFCYIVQEAIQNVGDRNIEQGDILKEAVC